MSFRRILPVFLILLLLASAALAQAPELRGYDKEQKNSYLYVTFGQYPYSKEGETAPVIWRVLGPGVPGTDDVINAANAPGRKDEKYANIDTDIPQDMQDVYCLMTEYIIDVVLYHDKKDVVDGPALDYVDTIIYQSMNNEIIDRLFTAAEQSVLVEMPERGLLGLPTRKGELFREDYGFVTEDFVKLARRSATGTPYAFAQGLKRIKGNSWYWTADWRRYGARWIVGDNGHISVSGSNREGGIRPVCYIHAGMLECTGGSGTLEDPYRLSVRSE